MEDTYPAELISLREAIRHQQAQQNMAQAMLQMGTSPYNPGIKEFIDLLRRELAPRGVQGGAPFDAVADLDGLRRLKAMTQQRGGGRIG